MKVLLESASCIAIRFELEAIAIRLNYAALELLLASLSFVLGINMLPSQTFMIFQRKTMKTKALKPKRAAICFVQ